MPNIILKKLLFNLDSNEQEKRRERTTLGWFKTGGIFEIVKILGENNFVVYFLVFAAIFGFFINKSVHLGVVFGFLLCVLLGFIILTKWKENAKDFYEDRQKKLEFLNNLMSQGTIPEESGALFSNNTWLPGLRDESFLYTNSAVVDFYYDYREFVNYNLASYINSIRACNSLLYLLEQMKISVQTPGFMLENGEILQKECLNHFQSCIFGLPSADATNEKYNRGLVLLHQITEEIIVEMWDIVRLLNKKNGVNQQYYPIEYGQPRPNDTHERNYNPHFDLYVG